MSCACVRTPGGPSSLCSRTVTTSRSTPSSPSGRSRQALIPPTDSRAGDAMAYETILVERKGGVAVIRINRPDKLNAMNAKVKEEVSHALGELEKDDTARVAVITGVGDKAFVAGADINEFAGKKPIDQWQSYGHTSLYNVVDRFPKPVLA